MLENLKKVESGDARVQVVVASPESGDPRLGWVGELGEMLCNRAAAVLTGPQVWTAPQNLQASIPPVCLKMYQMLVRQLWPRSLELLVPSLSPWTKVWLRGSGVAGEVHGPHKFP